MTLVQLIKSDNHYNQLLFGLSVKCTAEHKQLHVLVTLYNRGISICYFLKVKGLINKTRRMKLYKPQIKCPVCQMVAFYTKQYGGCMVVVIMRWPDYH